MEKESDQEAQRAAEATLGAMATWAGIVFLLALILSIVVIVIARGNNRARGRTGGIVTALGVVFGCLMFPPVGAAAGGLYGGVLTFTDWINKMIPRVAEQAFEKEFKDTCPGPLCEMKMTDLPETKDKIKKEREKIGDAPKEYRSLGLVERLQNVEKIEKVAQAEALDACLEGLDAAGPEPTYKQALDEVKPRMTKAVEKVFKDVGNDARSAALSIFLGWAIAYVFFNGLMVAVTMRGAKVAPGAPAPGQPAYTTSQASFSPQGQAAQQPAYGQSQQQQQQGGYPQQNPQQAQAGYPPQQQQGYPQQQQQGYPQQQAGYPQQQQQGYPQQQQQQGYPGATQPGGNPYGGSGGGGNYGGGGGGYPGSGTG
ncbi:MAG: hypothetical protein U0271_22780 [Polyangiaceae bacterium]